MEEEEDGMIYTVAVKHHHGAPNSPMVNHMWWIQTEKASLVVGYISCLIHFFLFSCSRLCLAPSVWKQEQMKSWFSTSSTHLPWGTPPILAFSCPPIDPSPRQRECWISLMTGGRALSQHWTVWWSTRTEQKCIHMSRMSIRETDCFSGNRFCTI